MYFIGMQQSGVSRILSIDQFRGFAILLMVAANYCAGVHAIPLWFKHSNQLGLTIVDLIAPFFIFAMGLTYGISAELRRARDGVKNALWHFAVRFLALLGIGTLLAVVEKKVGLLPRGVVEFNVLSAIGIAGLITLPFIFLHPVVRAVAGVGILIIYQIQLTSHWLAVVQREQHGGFEGSLSWGAMLLCATVVADLFRHRKKRWGTALAVAICSAGAALANIVPISKQLITASYVLISLGASGVVYAGFVLINDRMRISMPVLSAWGANALVLYLLHSILLGIFILPPWPWWYHQAPLWLAAIELVLFFAMLHAANRWMLRKNLVFVV